MMARLSSTSQSLGEAVGHASRYLPNLSMRRRGSSDAKPPPPPPLSVWVQLLSDEQQLVEVPPSVTLEELQLECERATGVPPELQRLCVQGALPRAGNLSGQHWSIHCLAGCPCFQLAPLFRIRRA